MSNVGLFIAQDITLDEIVGVLETLKEQLDAELLISGAFGATLSKDKANVYMTFIKKGVWGDNALDEMTQTLGIPQYVCIAMEMKPTGLESTALGLRFACACVEKWPCVLENDRIGNKHKIYSGEEICQLLQIGRSP